MMESTQNASNDGSDGVNENDGNGEDVELCHVSSTTQLIAHDGNRMNWKSSSSSSSLEEVSEDVETPCSPPIYIVTSTDDCNSMNNDINGDINNVNGCTTVVSE